MTAMVTITAMSTHSQTRDFFCFVCMSIEFLSKLHFAFAKSVCYRFLFCSDPRASLVDYPSR